jgi:hypothetical protein
MDPSQFMESSPESLLNREAMVLQRHHHTVASQLIGQVFQMHFRFSHMTLA